MKLYVERNTRPRRISKEKNDGDETSGSGTRWVYEYRLGAKRRGKKSTTTVVGRRQRRTLRGTSER
jgi:hypothetical protein